MFGASSRAVAGVGCVNSSCVPVSTSGVFSLRTDSRGCVMKGISVAVVLGAPGAFTAYLLVDAFRLHPFSLAAIAIRCATLTPCALWIDRHFCRAYRTPPYPVSILLWVTSPLCGVVLWLLVPRSPWLPDPPEAGLVREALLVLGSVGAPGTVFSIADYFRTRSSPKGNNGLPPARTERH